MIGQMCWLPKFGTNTEKILHLRIRPNEPWKPYTSFSEYSVPDYKDIPNGSKGWATLQKLLKEGWTVVPSPKPYEVPFNLKFTPDELAG